MIEMIDQKTKAIIKEELFSDKKKIRNLDAIKDLVKNKGWIVITDILDIIIARLSDKILAVKTEYADDEQDRELLGVFKWLRTLPIDLIQEIGDEPPENNSIPDHDPYPKSKERML